LWACSTAEFTITRRIINERERILNVDEELAAIGIAPEEAICIDLGYATAPFSDQKVIPEKTRRVFFGYIDTIEVLTSHKGMKVKISCRDAMRFLIENKFSGQIFNNEFRIEQSTGFDSRRTASSNLIPLTSKEVEELLKGAGLNDVKFGDTNQDGKVGITQDDFALSTLNAVKMKSGVLDKHKIMAWLIFAGSNGGCLPGILGEANDLRGDEIPIIEQSTRPITAPEEAGGGIMSFNVMNRFPLEVIKHIGSLEAAPRELYAHLDTGRICWRTRQTFRQDDPLVATFLIEADDGTPPNVISGAVDWSTIGTISELVVVNPIADNKSANQGSPGSGVLNISGRLPDDRFFPGAIPLAFPGLSHFVRRTRYIYDDTISSNDLNNARGLIDAMFRQWGKDVRAGTVFMSGNPLYRPGDCIQTFNLGMFNGQKFRIEAMIHKLIAQGPSKGYRMSVAFAEMDETRKDSLTKVIGTLAGEFKDGILGHDALIFDENFGPDSRAQRPTVNNTGDAGP
jgi:hypothetical protein